MDAKHFCNALQWHSTRHHSFSLIHGILRDDPQRLAHYAGPAQDRGGPSAEDFWDRACGCHLGHLVAIKCVGAAATETERSQAAGILEREIATSAASGTRTSSRCWVCLDQIGDHRRRYSSWHSLKKALSANSQSHVRCRSNPRMRLELCKGICRGMAFLHSKVCSTWISSRQTYLSATRGFLGSGLWPRTPHDGHLVSSGSQAWDYTKAPNFHPAADGATANEKANDRYSFAMVMFEIFTEKFFRSTRKLSDVHAWPPADMETQEPERPDMEANVPAAVQPIIRACWAQRKDERPILTRFCSSSSKSQLGWWRHRCTRGCPGRAPISFAATKLHRTWW